MGILGLELDTGLGCGGAPLQGIFGDFGKHLIVIVIQRKDAKLDDLRGNEFK